MKISLLFEVAAAMTWLRWWPLFVTVAFDVLGLAVPQLRARKWYNTKGALNVWRGNTPYDAAWRTMWVFFGLWHVAVLIHTFVPSLDAALSMACCPPIGSVASAKKSPLEEAASSLLNAAASNVLGTNGISLSSGVSGWSRVVITVASACHIIGLCIVMTGQAGMGKSWRMGIEGTEKRDDRSSELVETGIFAYSRNPIYCGVALVQIGHALMLPTLPALIAVSGFFAFIYLEVILEEEHLSKRHGPMFDAYCNRVPRWFKWPAVNLNP